MTMQIIFPSSNVSPCTACSRSIEIPYLLELEHTPKDVGMEGIYDVEQVKVY